MSDYVGDAVVLVLVCLAPVVSLVAARWSIRSYNRTTGWPRRFSWITGQLFITLLLLSLVFAAGETYYRFLYDETDVLDMSKASQRWHSRHYRFNNLGFRDDVDYANQPAPGKWRVTVLGDSFTAAAGVPEVADRFVNRLRASHPSDWEVQTFAENGADTGRQWYLLQTALLKGYQTNFVLVAYCPNDICDLMPGWSETGLRIKARYDALPVLVRHSYFLNTFFSRRLAASDPDCINYFDNIALAYEGLAWAKQKDRLRGLQQYCTQRGIGFGIVLFPFLHDLHDPRFVEVQKKLNEEFAFAPVLDLRPLLLGESSEHWVANAHDSHPNEAAHAVAAEAIEKFLAEQRVRSGSRVPAKAHP